MEDVRFYENSWFIALMIFLCFPLGVYLMWRYAKWDPASKVSISSLLMLVFFCAYLVYRPVVSSEMTAQSQTHESMPSEVAEEVVTPMATLSDDEAAEIKDDLWDEYDLGAPHMIGARGDTPLLATSTKNASAIDPHKWAVDYWQVYGVPDAEIYVFDTVNNVTTRLRNNGEDTLGLSIEQREGVDEPEIAGGKSFGGTITVCSYASYDKGGDLVIEDIGKGYN